MDSFLKHRKRGLPTTPLLEDIVESSFEQARTRFLHDTKIFNDSNLIKIKDKDSNRFTRFDYKHRNPDYFTKKMTDPMSISLKSLVRLEVQLKSASIRWVLKFIELNGISLLVNSLEQSIESDQTELEYKILICFKNLMNHYISVRDSFSNPSFTNQITISMCSSSTSSRKIVCEILISICYYKYPQGQKLILEALRNLSKQSNTYSTNPFEAWIKSWRKTVQLKNLHPAEECEYSLYNFMLANAIINVCDNSDTRNTLRRQMDECGFDKILEVAVRNEEIYKQIEEFYTGVKKDQPKKRLQNRRVFKNLLDPQNIFDMLLDSIKEDPTCHDHFLNSLQNILMYTSTHNDISTKIKYMESVDQYTFARCNSELTFEECIDLINEQNEIITRLSKDAQKYKKLYEEVSVEQSSVEKLNTQIEKNKSLEDLLNMSRNTISTLQQKLKEIQEEYEERNSTLDDQLMQQSCQTIEENIDRDIASINVYEEEQNDLVAKEDDKLTFIESKTQEKKINSIVNSTTKSERRMTVMSVTDEFKSQLAIQFSKTSLSKLAANQHQIKKLPRRHSIMSNNNRINDTPKVNKKKNRFSLVPGPLTVDKYDCLSISEPFNNSSTTFDSASSTISRYVNNNEDLLDPTPSLSESSLNSEKSECSSPLQKSFPPSSISNSIDIDDIKDIEKLKNTDKIIVLDDITQISIVLPAPLPHLSPNNIISSSTNSYNADNVTHNNTDVPLPPPPPPLPNLTSYFVSDNKNNKIIPTKSSNAHRRYPSVKTRVLQWQKLHKNHIDSTIWSEQKSTGKQGISKKLENAMDEAGLFKRMEETFSQEKPIKNIHYKKYQSKKKESQILEVQKSANISISVLMKLKHVPMEEVIKSLINFDSKIFDEVILENLLSNLPTTQERNRLESVPQDIVLSKPDAFCSELICVPKYKERIQCMLLKFNFQDRISHMSKSMFAIMNASTTLRNSIALKEFLNLVLLVGNFLNGSNLQGGAFGIRIDSINKLIDTKSSANETTLLHFIIDMMESQFPDVFHLLLLDLKCCIDACKVTLQDLINDYNELKADLCKLTTTLSECDGVTDTLFYEKLTLFRNEAIAQFDLLEVRYTSMDVAYKDVILYFGESSYVNPNEFFGIFVKFISDWERTHKELISRKEKVERMNRVHRFEKERRLLMNHSSFIV